jgi:hypothetical protein
MVSQAVHSKIKLNRAPNRAYLRKHLLERSPTQQVQLLAVPLAVP